MTKANVSVCVLAAALLAGTATAASTSGRMSRARIQCLPPGSSNPVSCATVAAGETLIVGARSQNSSAPLTLYFKELNQSRNPAMMRVRVPQQARVADGAYAVTIPRQICAGRQGRSQFEIRELWSEFNLLESVGVIDVGC